MATPFIGEIRMFAGNFAPVDWAFCDGRLISISDNPTLFQLIGTTYGGDGQTTYALPDLRSRVPVHQGAGMVIGQNGGQENVTLLGQQMPQHSHPLATTTTGSTASPVGALPSTATSSQVTPTLYGTGANKLTTLSSQSILPNTGGQPHPNLQPYLAISFIIALYGVYPSQN